MRNPQPAWQPGIASDQPLMAMTRRDRIAVVAYYGSEARGFPPGHEAEDWVVAQAQVDAEDAGIF